jgi:hypothetical protein
MWPGTNHVEGAPLKLGLGGDSSLGNRSHQRAPPIRPPRAGHPAVVEKRGIFLQFGVTSLSPQPFAFTPCPKSEVKEP